MKEDLSILDKCYACHQVENDIYNEWLGRSEVTHSKKKRNFFFFSPGDGRNLCMLQATVNLRFHSGALVELRHRISDVTATMVDDECPFCGEEDFDEEHAIQTRKS